MAGTYVSVYLRFARGREMKRMAVGGGQGKFVHESVPRQHFCLLSLCFWIFEIAPLVQSRVLGTYR